MSYEELIYYKVEELVKQKGLHFERDQDAYSFNYFYTYETPFGLLKIEDNKGIIIASNYNRYYYLNDENNNLFNKLERMHDRFDIENSAEMACLILDEFLKGEIWGDLNVITRHLK